jgi:hypothetical protein
MLTVGQSITDAAGQTWQLVAVFQDIGLRPTSGDFLNLVPNFVGDFVKFALFLKPIQWSGNTEPPDFPPLGFLIYQRIS